MTYSFKRVTPSLALLLASTAVVGWSPEVLAQESAAADSSHTIIVTALKRDTTLQETPIAISAIGGDDLAEARIQTIADMAATVPGLNFVNAGPGQSRVVLRGIQAAGEPTVGVYYDETPVTGPAGMQSDAGATTPELRMFDVERVEVLRGPQGTLYGSGSMGGTLRVIYQKPKFETEAAGQGSLSSTRYAGGLNWEANGMVNTVLVPDKIAVRAVGFYSRSGGWIDAYNLGIDNINETRSYGGRIMLRAKPTEDFTLDLAAYINRLETDMPWWTGPGKYQADFYARTPFTDKSEIYNATGVYDFGDVSLTGAVSYARQRQRMAQDATPFMMSERTEMGCAIRYNPDASPCSPDVLDGYYAIMDDLIPSTSESVQRMKTWTAELRLGSTGTGPLNWTAGVFFSDRKSDVDALGIRREAATGEPREGADLFYARYVQDGLRQYAAFGEVSYDVTDRLTATVGGRVFRYEKDVGGRIAIGSIALFVAPTEQADFSSNENGTVFKGNLAYKITDDVLVYGEISEGFRPGGVNQVIGLPDELAPYSSDKLTNYELGLKATTLGGALDFSVDVFQIDWNDMQVTGVTPSGTYNFITNAGAARIRGFEGEASLRPVPGLTLSGNVTVLDPKLTEDQANGSVVAQGRDGDRIPFVAKFTAGLSASYEWAIGDALAASARIDGRHVGSSYSEFVPDSVFARQIPSYELVNARLGLKSEDDSWSAALFVTNLFDDTAISRAFTSGFDVGRTLYSSAQPRTFGVSLGFHY
ncbi:TonB-dependent receptor [Novosphingobium mangrovi (ex Hu et al. 2023)]|uniref:TonB-dependent receptor n=1 Tax=Novosphingobium mangrovi (ex Hu et al. 2023) TaxID=2930094 RepID=A0ABT0AG26_9SPHN|nr:TonB-dependent receptor [Novosphingobium mangrovi (ex Hu et al. 2023)]MCJ1962132.1 TonB-dependent receptor [Novosphingobium mangrovi (ex Hu et al. 2023)]